MVNITKWIVIGAGLLFLGLFTQEAAATGLTGTLRRTGLSGASLGSGISSVSTGIGGGITSIFKGLLSPFWEVRNIVRGFMNLGSATPWIEDLPEQGGGSGSLSGGGGGETTPQVNTPLTITQSVPDQYGIGLQYYNNPISPSIPVSDTTVTWSSGQSVDLPLSAAAVKYYQNLGVQVEQADGGGVSDLSGGGGGIAATNTSSGWGTNVSTPTGGVASGNLSLSSWSRA